MKHSSVRNLVLLQTLLSTMLLLVLFTLFSALIAFKIYLKLTVGIVKCSKHQIGKVVIVTGGNAGIGFETAKDLADRGARVIIACRNEGRGINARDQIITATGNQDVHYRNLDLASLSSVRKFAHEINNTEKRIDILINNAGVADVENKKTEDDLLMGMQINHFGPFLLTNLLLPKLKASAPSRIINVSSMAHRAGVIDFQNLNMEKETDTFSFVQLYANTKLCNIYMMIELERQLRGTGVTVNCLHPGVVYTTIINHVEKPWIKYLYKPVYRFLISKNVWEGAQTTIYLAVSPEVSGVSGRYFSDCREEKLTKAARDPVIAKKLWEVSAQLVKLH